MPPLHLHIISFDIPYPANYGGVIDVYYKIKYLHQVGVKIHLHCYQYGDRKPAERLKEICESVHYYNRKGHLDGWSLSLPYIISSRSSDELLRNLTRDNHPILFEGLHTCFYLDEPSLKDREKLVRTHNVEWQYYRHLAKSESQLLKKPYFRFESMMLRKFERKLNHANHLLSISPNDVDYYSKQHQHVTYLPAFHPNNEIISQASNGQYILYHGNLSVSENIKAANFLISEVFPKVEIKCIIAGSNPRPDLIQLCQKHQVELIQSPEKREMSQLIQNAHINVLPTFQSTGIKLKLLNALYQGKFCLANHQMIDNTGLEKMCTIANSAPEFVQEINQLMSQNFDQAIVDKRTEKLQLLFSNKENAQTIVNLLKEKSTIFEIT